GVDAAIITPAPVLAASGHVDNFADPLIECLECHIRLRADHYLEEESEEVWRIRWRDEAVRHRKLGEAKATAEAEKAWQVWLTGAHEGENPREHYLVCPNCAQRRWSAPKMFNMMFATNLGPVEGEGSRVYLRPETAQ